MNRRSSFCAALTLLLTSSACMAPVIVNTVPSGADVVIDGASVGRSNLVQELDATASHVVEVSLQGYHSQRIDVISVPSGYGGRLSPDVLNLTLEPLEEPVQTPSLPASVALQSPGEAPMTEQMLQERLAQVDKLWKSDALSDNERQALRLQLLWMFLSSPVGAATPGQAPASPAVAP